MDDHNIRLLLIRLVSESAHDIDIYKCRNNGYWNGYWGNIMVVIKEINSAGFGKILTILAALMGISMTKKFGIFSLIFGKWAVLSLPIFYGVSGYFIGRIAASLYNTIVGSKKGFRVEVLR